jgi:hypothetical protein
MVDYNDTSRVVYSRQNPEDVFRYHSKESA